MSTASSLEKPLGRSDYVKIQSVRQELQRIKLAIDKACSAEIPSDNQKLICEDLQRKYDLLLQVYFPNGIPEM